MSFSGYRQGPMKGYNTQPVPPAQAPSESASASKNIEQLGQLQLPAPESNIYALTVIGQIEGHMILPPQNKTTKYEHVIPQLVAIEQSPSIEGLLIVLNTVGGDVEAGLAIAEMIDTLSKPAVSLVLGGGHSIGVPVAVSADHSFISETATMTVHPLRLTGNIWGIPQTYEYLDKMQDRVIRFVCGHSAITEEKYRELMFNTGQIARDIGTLLVGKDAVEVGLIDQVGGLGQAVKHLKEMIRLKKNGEERERH